MGLQPVKILAIDISAGTEDILLYDDEKESIESCVKIILPSPSKVFATNVREATRLRKDIFVKGDVVGGGSLLRLNKPRSKGAKGSDDGKGSLHRKKRLGTS